MRYITGGIALGTALVLGALAGTAQAATAPARPAGTTGLFAPTALVMTVAKGETRADAAVLRAVTLSCAPTATGSHPSPRAACAQLQEVSGEFDKVTAAGSDRVCTKEWDPVVVTADGVWQGRRVSYTHTFANSCDLGAGQGSVFSF